jgi:hypothetical protein
MYFIMTFFSSRRGNWGLASEDISKNGMALVRTDVSEERTASTIRME